MADLEVEVRELAKCSPDAIAVIIADAGVRGRRSSPCECPLARYLTRRTERSVSVGWGSAWDRDGVRQVLLPTSVQQFVRKVDRGVFPELVES